MQRSTSLRPLEGLGVLKDDLDGIEQRILESREAETLTQVAIHLIEGRLRGGAPSGACPLRAASAGLADEDRVRLWDPATAWHVGDHGLFALPVTRGGLQASAPRVGIVTKVNANGRSVSVRIDGVGHVMVYGTAPCGRADGAVAAWRKSVEDWVGFLVDRIADGGALSGDDASDEDGAVLDLEAWTDYALWRYGERLVSELLYAMRQDGRFVCLEERWFLRGLAAAPSTSQLETLARTLLSTTDCPLTADEMLRWVPSPVSTGDAGRFGLALALFERPDLFRNVDVDAWPRWELAGPPTGSLTARYAAFDPETYDVLCEPGEPLTSEAVERLWALGLLASVAKL